MAGRQVLTPERAMAALRHEIPRGTEGGQDCEVGGNFRIEAICKLLYYFTQDDVTLAFVVQNETHLAPQAPRYTKWEVLQNYAPAGCTALYIHTPGHFVCWRQSPVDQKWYELDSIPFGGGTA